MLGTVSANAATVAALKNTVRFTGLCEGPDDVYLGLRGLRTLGVRLDRHFNPALRSRAGSKRGRKFCACCILPCRAIPATRIWKRDFTGASGLFSMVLKPVPQKAVLRLLDELELFGIGASWGGFESLAIPFDCTPLRTATRWAPGGPTRALPHRPGSGRRSVSPISNAALRR